MDEEEIKRQARIDLLRLGIFLFQRLKKISPDERQDFVASLKIPDDILTEFYSMTPKRSDLKPVFKAEMEKRGIQVD